MRVQINKHKESDYCNIPADVYIPHQIMRQTNVSNDTKLMVGTICSEAMRKAVEITLEPIKLISEIIIDECENISLENIRQVCMCDYPEAIRIKQELAALSSTNAIEISVLDYAEKMIRSQKQITGGK